MRSSRYAVHTSSVSDENAGLMANKPVTRSSMGLGGATRGRAALGDISNRTTGGNDSSRVNKRTFTEAAVTAPPQPEEAKGQEQEAAMEETTQQMARIAIQQPTRPAHEVDEADRHNPLAVTEYVDDMFDHYRALEVRRAPSPTYMDRQARHAGGGINHRMRAILVDWLVEVHLKFKLQPETLFLSINVIDRYLELATVERQRLQLVGVTAMLIASKYEENMPPEVRDFVFISDNAYSREDILDMEKEMLDTLGFHVTSVSPLTFLSRFCKIAGGGATTKTLACFYMERTLQEYGMLQYLPSTIAAAALSLSLQTTRHISWSRTLQQCTGYSEEALAPCIREIVALVEVSKSGQTKLKAVQSKFSSAKFLEVAKLPLPPTASA